MVLTRSATKKIESGQATSRDAPVEHPPGLTKKKHRRQASPVAAPEEYPLTRNLDVLVLIVTYISPGDLLNLARTCTSIRQLLMDKSSAFIWRACRRQVDRLPDCPVDLSEPEYAHLAFHLCCHSCGDYAGTIFWQLRRRYCARCRVTQLCTPSSLFRSATRGKCVIGLEHTTLKEGKGRPSYYVDKDQMDAFMFEYLHASNKAQFVKDSVERRVMLSKDADDYRRWERENALACLQERDHSIFQHLKQLGFEPEVAHYTRFRIRQSHQSLFYKPTPFTDEEWSQHLPALLETMNKLRSKLEREIELRNIQSEVTTRLKSWLVGVQR